MPAAARLERENQFMLASMKDPMPALLLHQTQRFRSSAKVAFPALISSPMWRQSMHTKWIEPVTLLRAISAQGSRSMIPEHTLTLTAALHAEAQTHLFPGDGLEAAGLMLCSRAPGKRSRLLAQQFIRVLYSACRKRTPDEIIWPGEYLETAIDAAEPQGLSIIAIHSHPGGLFEFSDADDESDARVIPCFFQALGFVHGSAVMVPGGAVRALSIAQDGSARYRPRRRRPS